jgi:hypothetical protein
MRQRILGLAGGKRRRRFLLGVVASVAALGAFMISNALAVHDLVFQLDGDVDHTTTTTVGGTTQTIDWDNFFDASGNRLPLPTDFAASTFDRDFVTNANGSFSKSDTTTWATGSKDTLAITPTNWQCKRDQNLLDKDDIMNAYAAAYEPAGGDEVLYFALERNGNNGASNVGFWFLQDGNVNCESPGGNTPFTGSHTTGDLLVVSEFTNGGTVSTINVYEWVGGPNGSLNPTPVASGADCETTDVPPSDEACATVNDAPITTPWLTVNKTSVGHSLADREFFEGGINLTDTGLGGKCFNTFLASTRASQELGANLHDFSRGSLGICTSTTETTPVDSANNPIPAAGLNIPTDPNDAALQVKDKATITVTGADPFEGTVTYHLCGPFAASSTTVCDTGGVLISSEDITTNGDYFSEAATVTSAGRYCWRADFTSTTQGVPDSSDSSATECFKVNPVKPSLTTEAGAGPVDFGQPVTDTATLTGTAHKPGTGGPAGSTDGSINPATLGGDATGTITFTLYKDDACTQLATGTGTNPQTRTVSGDGTYGPVSFTPDAPGTYHWVASYGGDLPNTLASDASACLDENEDVVARQIPTTISTAQRVYPNDSATVSSTVAGKPLPAGGEVVFKLFEAAGGNTALQNCQANTSTGLLYTETDDSVGGGQSDTASTNNQTAAVSADATVYWRVTYDPKNATFTGRQSACVENTVVDLTDDSSGGTLFP